MGDKSNIEWTDATWNPIVGCSIVSPGCTNCYAMKAAGGRVATTPKYEGLTKPSKAGPVWTGAVRLWEKTLLDPLRWRTPRTIFVNSMGDLFHEAIPDEAIDRIFAVMALAPQHRFQVLTKRAKRMRDYFSTADDAKLGLPKGEGEQRDHVVVAAFNLRDELSDGKPLLSHSDEECIINPEGWPLPNVWLGVSAEDQTRADERVPLLLETPAAVRFVSAEPLLGPIDFGILTGETADYYPLRGQKVEETGQGDSALRVVPRLDWIIVGGESGPKARPMHPDWARSIRDQCQAADVPFFFKQWGEYVPNDALDTGFERMGKKAAGRLLDGRTHDEMPA